MKGPARKSRLDDFLVQKGWASDLKLAGALILAGRVRINGHPIQHAGHLVADHNSVTFESAARFVSRAGEKLFGALRHFDLRVSGLVCLDIGASTGGFTDCLLQAGAAKVYALDVGKSLLDSTLRADPRVVTIENENVRHWSPVGLDPRPTFVVVDVSFISLLQVLPVIKQALRADEEALVMVKPQFEGDPKEVPGGFVRDESTRQSILSRIEDALPLLQFKLLGKADSDVEGRHGNLETFFYLKRL